jgi:hypothetical protein
MRPDCRAATSLRPTETWYQRRDRARKLESTCRGGDILYARARAVEDRDLHARRCTLTFVSATARDIIGRAVTLWIRRGHASRVCRNGSVLWRVIVELAWCSRRRASSGSCGIIALQSWLLRRALLCPRHHARTPEQSGTSETTDFPPHVRPPDVIRKFTQGASGRPPGSVLRGGHRGGSPQAATVPLFWIVKIVSSQFCDATHQRL